MTERSSDTVESHWRHSQQDLSMRGQLQGGLEHQKAFPCWLKWPLKLMSAEGLKRIGNDWSASQNMTAFQ